MSAHVCLHLLVVLKDKQSSHPGPRQQARQFRGQLFASDWDKFEFFEWIKKLRWKSWSCYINIKCWGEKLKGKKACASRLPGFVIILDQRKSQLFWASNGRNQPRLQACWNWSRRVHSKALETFRFWRLKFKVVKAMFLCHVQWLVVTVNINVVMFIVSLSPLVSLRGQAGKVHFVAPVSRYRRLWSVAIIPHQSNTASADGPKKNTKQS